MANEVMGTLFGVTPEALMAERDRQTQAQAFRVAQLDPLQQARYSGFMAANQFGNAVGGLLGAEDPELMRIRQRQSLLQGIDLADPAALRQAASTAMQSGDNTAAMQLAQRAMDVEQSRAKLASEQALVTQRNAQASRERQQAIPADIQTAQRISALRAAIPQYEAAGDTETAGQLKVELEELTRLTTKEGQRISFGADRESIAAELYNKPFANLTQTEKAEVNRREAALGKGKTTVSLSVKQDEAVTKSNVEAFGGLRDRAIAAGQTVEAVKTIKPLIDRSFAGFGANAKLTAAQIADALGVPVSGASETEQLRSLQNNLKIGNSSVLKGAISDKDMAILGEAIGQGTVTKAGLRGIINNIEKDALITQREYQLANDFQQRGKIQEYDFVKGSSQARSEINDKLKRLRELEAKAAGGR